MTLDEAIKHCEEVAENQEECACRIDEIGADSNSIRECASEHRQLAEWLRELKALRAEQKDVYEKGYEEGYEDGYCYALEDSH